MTSVPASVPFSATDQLGDLAARRSQDLVGEEIEEERCFRNTLIGHPTDRYLLKDENPGGVLDQHVYLSFEKDGQTDPYGVAVVPATVGALTEGHILVSNRSGRSFTSDGRRTEQRCRVSLGVSRPSRFSSPRLKGGAS